MCDLFPALTCVYCRSSLQRLQGKRQSPTSVLLDLLLLGHGEEDEGKLDDVCYNLGLTRQQPDVSSSEAGVGGDTFLHGYA